MWKWWMAGACVLAMVSVADAAESGQPRTIDVQIRNDAGVADDVVERAQQEVTRIFADAGLPVQWTDTAPRFVVTILPQVLGYARSESPVMGVAQRGPTGATIRVFLKQVRDFAVMSRIDLSTMLAYVIAHELGHLFLGAPHAPTGLMQAEWSKRLMREAANGSLTFTDAQAQRIRALY
jgi:hypothetical protein